MKGSIIRYKAPVWPLFLLFFTSVDTVLFGTNGNRIFLFVPRIMAFLGIFLLPLYTSPSSLNRKSVFFLLLYCFIVTISVFYNNGDPLTLISRLLFVCLAFQIVRCYNFKDFIAIYDKFLYIISITALVTFVISYVAPFLFSLFYMINNENGITFSTFLIGSFDYTELNSQLKRMNAIFWEPGAYAIYLCVGLIFRLFYFKKVDKKRCLIYTAALLVTFSTTGIIGFSVILFAYFISINKKGSKLQVLGGVLFTLFLFAAGLLDSIYSLFFSKITNMDPTTVVRISSFINGFQIAFDNPILGVGGRSSEFMPTYAENSGFGSNAMLTNTVVHQFANYGFIAGGILLYGTYLFFRKYSAGIAQGLLLFLSLILLYVGEVFFSFFPYLFMFYGFKSKKY